MKNEDNQNLKINDLKITIDKNVRQFDGNDSSYSSPKIAAPLPAIIRQRRKNSSQARNQMNAFDGQKIPPDFKKSENHRMANKVGPEKDINEMKEDETIEYCECCARQIQREQLGLKCNNYEFSFLGSGYPIYFQFQNFGGVFNVITNIIGRQKCDVEKNGDTNNSSQNNNIQNNNNTSTSEEDAICKQGSVFSLFSLGSKSQQNTFMEVQGYLNLASLVVMIFLLQFFRRTQRQLDNKCDDEDISANDYTIIVKNIPKEFDALNDDYDDDLKEYFKLNSQSGKEVHIESVTLCYNLEEIAKIETQKSKVIQNKKKYIEQIHNLNKKIDEVQLQTVEKHRDQEQEIRIIKEQPQSHESSQAIKTLNHIKQSQEQVGLHPQLNDIFLSNKQKMSEIRDHSKQRLSIFAQANIPLNQQNSQKSHFSQELIINNIQNQLKKIENDAEVNIVTVNNEVQFHINNSPDRFIKVNKIENDIFFNTEKKLINEDEEKAKQIEENKQKIIIKINQKKIEMLAKLNDKLSEEQLKLKETHLQISKFDRQLQSLKEKLMDGKGKEFMKKYFTGIAFVCLRYEQDKEDIIEKYRPIGFADKVISKKNLTSHSMIYHNNKLKIYQAPDPTDVNWDNLHFTAKQKLKRRIIGFLITIIVLFLCAIAIYAFHLFQEDQINHGEDQTRLQLVSLSLAVTISILNFLLCIILQLLSAFCKYSTRTEVNIFVAKGLSIARFINSALISFIIQIFVSSKDKQKTLFGDGGIAENANYFMLSNCFVPAIAQIVNIEYYALEFLRKIEIKKGKYSLKTQYELNQLFENPQFPIEERYAQLLMTMFTTAFYCPIVPMTIIWSIIGLILQYWIDKYNLIYRSSVKYNMSADLSIEMTNHLEYFLPIQSISTLIFYQYANGGDWGLSSIIGTAIGLLHAFLPMQLINERIFEVEKAIANTIDYEEAQKYFITDYNRENPIYKQHARQSHVKKMTMKVSHQKTFLKLNTLRSLENELSANAQNFTNRIQNETKSIFHNQSPIQSEYNRNTLFQQKSSENNERISELHFEQGKDSIYNHEDDLQNTKNPSQFLQQQRFSLFKQITNETQQGFVDEEVKFEKTNYQFPQHSQTITSPPHSIHNNSYFVHQNEGDKKITIGRKIQMNKLNQKGNEIECVDLQPNSVILLTQNDSEENQLFQKESSRRKNQSCDFYPQQSLLLKPSKFSYYQQVHSDEKLNVKYQNRKNQDEQEQNIIQNTHETNEDCYSLPNIHQTLPTQE